MSKCNSYKSFERVCKYGQCCLQLDASFTKPMCEYCESAVNYREQKISS